MPTRIWLVGFMGSGKSGTSGAIARALGYAAVDLDDQVAKRAGHTIDWIFRHRGEDAFRALERVAFAAAARRSRVVVATGGGVVEGARQRTLLRRERAIWLTARPRTLSSRVSGRGRPLWGASFPRALYDRRLPLYRAASRMKVVTDGRSVEAVAGEILRRIGRRS